MKINKQTNKKTKENKNVIINLAINGVSVLKTLGNIIWVIFGGLEWAILLLVSAISFCVTIVGIPIGIQLFKMAGFVVWPFGRKLTQHSIGPLKLVLNIVWAVLCGWFFAIGFFVTGILFYITIIGIPFGNQYMKLAGFVLMPLGKQFE